MPLVPFERVTLRAQLSLDELHRRLAAAVEPEQGFRNPFSRDHKPYEGEISRNGFTIRRVIHYRNSFLPLIVGTIKSDAAGCVIEAVLKLHPAVLAFMVVWLGAAAAAAMVGAFEISRDRAYTVGLIPLFMFVLGYAFPQGAFLFESRKAKRFFEELIR